VVYVALLFALRVFGKREIGQFTVFDLVFVLLVANALQPAMTGPDTSLTGGFVLIVALVGANFLVGQLDRVPVVHRLFTPKPSVVIKDGKYVKATMEREGITEDEIDMAIREHGLEGAKDVRLAELEADGSISVVSKDSKTPRRRRRVRFIRRP
jgi:uncharacterized membrane protein YcaP (DUF421 family)